MSFYPVQHRHYFCTDLPGRAFYLCILDAERNVLFHKNHPRDLTP